MLKKKSVQKVADSHLDDREDDLGPYPHNVDSNPTQQKILERALRMSTIGLGVSAAANVALVGLIIAILPLKEVYPYLVTFKDSDDQVVALEPIGSSAPGIKYATEASVRQYVKLRHTFSPIESFMDAQWGKGSQLAAMTDSGEFGEFERAAGNERTQMMSRGFSRSIDIESATMINPGTWQVAFKTTETLGGNSGTLTPEISGPPTSQSSNTLPTNSGFGSGTQNVGVISVAPARTTRTWLATMTVDYQPQRISYDSRLLNPLGFTVTDYSVIERN